MKNSIRAIKNIIELIGNRADHPKESISEVKVRHLEMIQVEKER